MKKSMQSRGDSPDAGMFRWRVVWSVGIFNLGLLLIFPNCATSGPYNGGGAWPGDAGKTAEFRKEILRRESYPETVWNRKALWEKINSAPAMFVPSGYSSVAKYDYFDGTWFVDPEDGKRLFAPSRAWGNLDSGFWREEAKKISEHLWLPLGSN